MMEKDPTERIQSAQEVADRLAPWAADNSPIVSDEFGRQRWMPMPLQSIDNQDTDPNLDIAEMAMNEMSGSHSGHMQGTIGVGDSVVDTGSFSASGSAIGIPGGGLTAEQQAVPKTVSEKFSAAGHLDDEMPTVSSRVMFLAATVCGIVGAAAGFLIGWLVGPELSRRHFKPPF